MFDALATSSAVHVHGARFSAMISLLHFTAVGGGSERLETLHIGTEPVSNRVGMPSWVWLLTTDWLMILSRGSVLEQSWGFHFSAAKGWARGKEVYVLELCCGLVVLRLGALATSAPHCGRSRPCRVRAEQAPGKKKQCGYVGGPKKVQEGNWAQKGFSMRAEVCGQRLFQLLQQSASIPPLVGPKLCLYDG